MPKIDIASLPVRTTSNYPQEFRTAVEGRSRIRLGDAVGLTQFGVNICRLEPGAASSLRHWHEHQDELVYMLEGEAVLVEDAGETVLKAGDAAGWKANSRNGHHLVNRSHRDAVFIEIGTRTDVERVEYPDVDLIFEKDATGTRRQHKSGAPYPQD